jgi:hypothetical protein
MTALSPSCPAIKPSSSSIFALFPSYQTYQHEANHSTQIQIFPAEALPKQPAFNLLRVLLNTRSSPSENTYLDLLVAQINGIQLNESEPQSERQTRTATVAQSTRNGMLSLLSYRLVSNSQESC